MSNKSRNHWYPAYIGLGSNLLGPVSQVESALELIASIRETRLVRASSFYRSEPFGGIEQPDFVNAAASVLTRLGARQLLHELQGIESRRGRERNGPRWGPRVIDLDLLVYGSVSIDEPDLIVPHPGISERNFVLLPLIEVAPDLLIPGLGRLAGLATDMDEPHIERIA